MWTLWESRVLCEISKPLLGAFCASTGAAASTSSSTSRRCSMMRSPLKQARARKGGYRGSGPLETIAPGASCTVELSYPRRRSRALLGPSFGAKAALELGGTDIVKGRVPPSGVVEVDKPTPIVLSCGKSATRGIPGSVVRSLSTRCSSSRGIPSVGAVSRRSGIVSR
jgi:hypothetical protein